MAENPYYTQLMRLTEPVEGREYPTIPYRQYMKRESTATTAFSISEFVPGLQRHMDWVEQGFTRITIAEERAKAYLTYMRLRQQAFAVGRTVFDAVIPTDTITKLPEQLGPELAEKQLRLMIAQVQMGGTGEAQNPQRRFRLWIAEPEMVANALGEHRTSIISFMGGSEHAGTYVEMPFTDAARPHEAWYPADRFHEDAMAGQFALRAQIGPRYDPVPALDLARSTLADL